MSLTVCVCCPQVDTAAQIPWYERLSEFKLPWEIHGNKETAIDDLSLSVHSGQMLAVIGSSGLTHTHTQALFVLYVMATVRVSGGL